MPAIMLRPRPILLYLVDRLEQDGSKPTSQMLVDICAKIQGSGKHIYSFSADPQDFFLQGSIAYDLQDCQWNGWMVKNDIYLSLTESGRRYLSVVVPPEGIEAKIQELLPQYRPSGNPLPHL